MRLPSYVLHREWRLLSYDAISYHLDYVSFDRKPRSMDPLDFNAGANQYVGDNLGVLRWDLFTKYNVIGRNICHQGRPLFDTESKISQRGTNFVAVHILWIILHDNLFRTRLTQLKPQLVKLLIRF